MFRSAWILAVAVVFGPSLSHAGTLRCGVPQLEGNHVIVPVVLEGDVAGGVAALDFTLNYDPAVFSPVGAEASAAAQAARKQVESNEVSPGNYVVMMFGMNQTTVENGQVASITLNKHAQPASNQSSISIQETTFASLDGIEIASEGSSQTVTFPPPPTDDGGNENPPPTDAPTPPVEPPTNTPTPSPAPPVPTPNTPTPSAPGVPAGTPPTSKPTTDSALKVTPMAIASSAIGEPPAQDSVSGSVARLNRASRKLENSRAALGQSVHINGDASDAHDAIDETEPTQEDGAAKSADSQSTAEPPGEMNVALAPVTGAQLRSDGARVPDAVDEAPDSSGIPPASRRMLIVVGAVIAVSIVVFRLARRSVR